MTFCPHCGGEIKEEAIVCKHCNQRIDPNPSQSPPKKKTPAKPLSFWAFLLFWFLFTVLIALGGILETFDHIDPVGYLIVLLRNILQITFFSVPILAIITFAIYWFIFGKRQKKRYEAALHKEPEDE